MQLSIFDLEKGTALICEIQELLAQPEQELEVLKKDWVNFGYTTGRKEGYKRGYASYKANMVELRDRFAGMAMQGLLASPVMGDCALHNSHADWLEDITKCSYDFADFMMEERKKRNEIL